jgi:hypothetical protein
LSVVLQQLGRIHAAAFSDAVLHSELLGKALFWQQPNFFGLDMTHLHQPALEGYFTQVRHTVSPTCKVNYSATSAGQVHS